MANRYDSEVRAATLFAGEVHRMIVDLKYHNHRTYAARLGDLLATEIRRHGAAFDLVTWAPTSSVRRRRRGYDQAELIARRVARRLDVPARQMLRRKSSVAQTGRNRRQRLDGPVFLGHPASHGCRILVVDDVTTTGATLRSARRALCAVGAEFVECWAVAATPAR